MNPIDAGTSRNASSPVRIQDPIIAKKGVLRVLIIARISTVHQDVRSLDTQIEKCKRYVHDNFGQSVEFEIIRSQGSGERLDSVALADAERLIETGTLDIVIAEDLGRLMRRTRAVDFCEQCEDVDNGDDAFTIAAMPSL